MDVDWRDMVELWAWENSLKIGAYKINRGSETLSVLSFLFSRKIFKSYFPQI
jgi:hypothetical protein